MRWSLNLLLLPFWFCSRPCLSWKTFENIVRIRHILVKQILKKNDYFVRNYKDFKVGKYIGTVLSVMVSVPPNMDISGFPICFLIEIVLPWKNLGISDLFLETTKLYLSWNSAFYGKKFIPGWILKQLSHRRLTPAFPSFLGNPSPVWAAGWSSGEGSGAAWKLMKSPPGWHSLRNLHCMGCRDWPAEKKGH